MAPLVEAATAAATTVLTNAATTLATTALANAATVLVTSANDNAGTTLVTSVSKISTRAQVISTATRKPCSGCSNPDSINNKAFFALFAILGVVMVLGGIWFFFWAKNGGFKWQEGDWDDYKSTVLRRKGPDGKTLYSSSSKSSSVTHEQKQRAVWAAKSVIAVDQTGRKGIMGKRGFGNTHSCAYRDDFTNYEGEYRDNVTVVTRELSGRKKHLSRHGSINEAPVPRGNGQYDMKQYRSERPAEVGGMNRRAEGSNFEFSGSEAMSADGARKSKKRVRAEQAAMDESERMEQKWRKEAERVASLIAKERAARAAQADPATWTTSANDAPRPPRHGAHRGESRTSSPRKKEYAPSQSNSDESRSGYHRSPGERAARRAERSARHSKRDISMPGSFDG